MCRQRRDPFAADRWSVSTDREREAAFAWSEYRSPWPDTVEDIHRWAEKLAKKLTDDQWEALATNKAMVMEADNNWPEGGGAALSLRVEKIATELRRVNLVEPLKSKLGKLRRLGAYDRKGLTPLGRRLVRYREQLTQAASAA